MHSMFSGILSAPTDKDVVQGERKHSYLAILPPGACSVSEELRVIWEPSG